MRDDVLKVSGTTPEQRARWRDAAGGGKRDLSAWIRDLVDEAAEQTGPRATRRDALDTLTEAVVGFRSALGSGPGNALNQVARALNVDIKAGVAPTAAGHERDLAAAYAEIQGIRTALNRALDRLEDLRP